MDEKIGQRMKVGGWLWQRRAGVITGEDNVRLEAWLDSDHAHRALARTIDDELDRNLSRPSADDAAAAWRRFSIRYRIGRTVSRTGRILRRSAVAASLLILAAAYLFMRSSADREETVLAARDIVPIRSTPVLTLGDGRQIELDDRRGALVAMQEDTRIVTVDDVLVYAPAAEGDPASKLPQINTIHVPPCGDCRIRLSDATSVTLNASSTLRFPARFPAGERTVWLEGEAFFDVAHDTAAPFTVCFPGGSIVVHGTRFNAEAYPERGEYRITLVEGAVSCRTDNDSCELRPGFQAVVDRAGGGIRVEQADTMEATAWTRGRFFFRNRPLGLIMDELSEWYEVEIVFEDESLRGLRFNVETGRFDSLAAILDLMKETGRMNYRQQGRTVWIYR